MTPPLVEEEAPFLKHIHVWEREKKSCSKVSTRLEAKNACAGEDQQQLNRPTELIQLRMLGSRRHETVAAENRQSSSCRPGLGARESPAGNDVREEDIVESPYQATTDKERKDLACAVVRSPVRELARTL
jgi:hypothetical protein